MLSEEPIVDDDLVWIDSTDQVPDECSVQLFPVQWNLEHFDLQTNHPSSNNNEKNHNNAGEKLVLLIAPPVLSDALQTSSLYCPPMQQMTQHMLDLFNQNQKLHHDHKPKKQDDPEIVKPSTIYSTRRIQMNHKDQEEQLILEFFDPLQCPHPWIAREQNFQHLQQYRSLCITCLKEWTVNKSY